MSAAVNGYPGGVRWESVCPLDQLQPGRGVAALLDGRQVALFRLVGAGDAADGTGAVAGVVAGVVADVVHAIDNIDPISGAAVLSRGILGDRQGRPVVASPVYKQAFCLETGQCLDQPDQRVEVFKVRVTNGWVQVGLL